MISSQVRRVVLKGFKSIAKMELELGPLTVMIGANGAGKSNFLGLFEMMRNMAESNLQVYIGKAGGADRVLHYGQKTTDALEIEIEGESFNYRCRLVPTSNDSLVFERETLTNGESQRELLKGGNRESLMEETDFSEGDDKGEEFSLVGVMKRWNVYHFNDTSDSARVKKNAVIDDNRVLRTDGSNIAAILSLFRKKHDAHYRNIVDTVRMAAPFFDDFVLEPSKLKQDTIKLEWRHRESDAYFDAAALSDGTLRFICLAALLQGPELPPVILLDEPELGLHPYALTLLSGMIRGAAAKTQVIVSTQSVGLVNQCAPEDIVVVDREKGESRFRRLTSEELSGWLEDYGLGELWEKNVFGGRPN